MKRITLFLSALLFSMMSFAATTVTFTAGADRGNAVTDYNNAAAFEVTKDGVTIAVSQGIIGTYNNVDHYRIYKNQTLKVTSTTGNITSIQVTCTANDAAKYGPGCFTAAEGNYAYSGAVGTWTGSATELTFSASTNQVRATEIVVTIDGESSGETPSTPDPDDPDTPTGEVITCAEARAICEATDTIPTTEEYTIRGYVTEIKSAYSTQYGNVDFWMADTIDGGQVLLAFRVKPVADSDKAVKVGDFVEVKGTLVNYKGNTPEVNAGGTYSIITPGEGGNETPDLPDPANVLTCAQARDICELVGTTSTPNEYTIRGYVTEIKSAYSEQYKNIDFWMADAIDGGQVLLAFRVKPIVDADIDVKVGDFVEVKGTLINYMGNTPEVNANGTYTIINAGESNDVNIRGLQYGDAYYYTADDVAYYEFDLYKDYDSDYVYPELYIAVEAKNKTAINGTYDVLFAQYRATANDSVYMDEVLGTVTIKNTNESGDYQFKGSFVGMDSMTYHFDQTITLVAYDADADYEEISLEENDTPDTPVTPTGAIVFDADVDKGNASTDYNSAGEFTVSKNGVTMIVTQGIIGTYNNESHYRIYKNQTLTVTSTVGNIEKIEFTCTANDDTQYGPGCFTVEGNYSYSGALGTWTGDAAEVVFTASSNQVRATQIVVTIAGASTDVENVVVGEEPVKVIENGQLLIKQGNKVYTILGAQVK